MEELWQAIDQMTKRIVRILEGNKPTVYLYGSVALGDFQLGWSDIDILVLTEKSLSEDQAQALVTLRQQLLEEEPGNPYTRSFEGAMLSREALLTGAAERVVYWGTSGQRIAEHYRLDAFGRSELLDSGILLYGEDVREALPRPSYEELWEAVRQHWESIRQVAGKTGRSYYTYGWLLDISRGLYTLRTGKISAKTAAGDWALKEGLCPCQALLERALAVRKAPLRYQNQLEDAAELEGDILGYADVLAEELAKKAAF